MPNDQIAPDNDEESLLNVGAFSVDTSEEEHSQSPDRHSILLPSISIGTFFLGASLIVASAFIDGLFIPGAILSTTGTAGLAAIVHHRIPLEDSQAVTVDDNDNVIAQATLIQQNPVISIPDEDVEKSAGIRSASASQLATSRNNTLTQDR